MLESLVGSTNAERILLFMAEREKGYAQEIAKTFDVAPSQIQRVLDRMERDGMFVSNEVGRTRVYEFNPRFPFRDDVKAMFSKALTMYPDEIQAAIRKGRRRPRRKDKPL
jgi:adenosyl cobinamide kinase/adenosyl cobinamide phosphate guanylyltransferase